MPSGVRVQVPSPARLNMHLTTINTSDRPRLGRFVQYMCNSGLDLWRIWAGKRSRATSLRGRGSGDEIAYRPCPSKVRRLSASRSGGLGAGAPTSPGGGGSPAETDEAATVIRSEGGGEERLRRALLRQLLAVEIRRNSRFRSDAFTRISLQPLR